MHNPLFEARGKPVALIFVSHDCPVCNGYAPEFGRLIKRFGQRVRINFIYSEPGLTLGGAKRHAVEFSLRRASLFLDTSRKYAEFCGAKVTPEALLYDATGRRVYDGRIDDRYVSLGIQRPFPTTHDFRSALDAVLAHKMPKAAGGPSVGCFILASEKP